MVLLVPSIVSHIDMGLFPVSQSRPVPEFISPRLLCVSSFQLPPDCKKQEGCRKKEILHGVNLLKVLNCT